MPKKYMALTFDDGPNTYSTPDIIKRLKLKKAVATFFLIGVNINGETAKVAKEALDNGNEIANHSYSHTRMHEMTADKVKEEVQKTEDLIMKYLGVQSKFFRPPFLNTSSTMYENIDQTFIAGTTGGANDWDEKVESEEVVSAVVESACDGMIVLLHDSQAKNANTVSGVVGKLRDQGYEFVTLSQLFEIKGVQPEEYQMYSYV